MKKDKLPNIIVILILTLITVLFWTLFSVYRVFTVKPAPSVPEEVLIQIEPTLDTKTLDEIQGRVYFNQ